MGERLSGTIRKFGSPIVRAALIRSGSTVCTPAIVLSSTGKKLAYATMAIFDVSPIPSSSVNTGNNASAAVFPEELEHRIEETRKWSVPRDQQTERHRSHDREAEPDARSGEARREVRLQSAALRELPPGVEIVVQRRQEDPCRLVEQGVRPELPQQQEATQSPPTSTPRGRGVQAHALPIADSGRRPRIPPHSRRRQSNDRGRRERARLFRSR